MALTPAQEAQYALDFEVDRKDLKPEVQTEYDRLVAERPARPPVPPADPLAWIITRTPPEVRARILAMFKEGKQQVRKAV